MKTFFVALSAIFVGSSIFNQMHGHTMTAIWLVGMATLWLGMAKFNE